MSTPYLRITVKTVLIEARESITDPANWQKGPSMTTDGPCCAVVAVARTCRKYGHLSDVEITAYDTLRDCLPSSWSEDPEVKARRLHESVPQFNDHRTTEHADVLAVFDRAVEAMA